MNRIVSGVFIKSFSIIGSIIILSTFSSCNQSGSVADSGEKQQKDIRKPLMEMNKRFVEEENRMIDDLVQRYQWPVQVSGTGLRYMIYKKTKGKKAKDGDLARIKYELRLMNGDLCYSSDNEGIKEIVLGHDPNESGLQEGILYMHEGERSKFILPSHLAFGISGDGQCIPPRAALIYDVELLELLKPK